MSLKNFIKQSVIFLKKCMFGFNNFNKTLKQSLLWE
jgi:hypothetical protein